MKDLTELSLDDLVCIYKCVSLELDNIRLGCMPDTLRDYFNQLNRVCSHVHSLILEKAKDD